MPLAAPNLSIDAILHYSDGRGAATRRPVTIKSIAVRDGDLQFGAYCHLRKGPRDFLGRRIIDLAHADTGELLSPIEFAAPLLGTTASELASRISAKLRERVRTTEVGISFGADGLAEGWAFGVPDAFRAALDIILMTYVRTVKRPGGSKHTDRYRQWSRGVPPARQFDVGDLFYDPPKVRGMRWSDALASLKRSVQITAALPDELVEGSPIVVPGSVMFRVTTYDHGEAVGWSEHQCTQAEFEDFLRAGKLPG